MDLSVPWKSYQRVNRYGDVAPAVHNPWEVNRSEDVSPINRLFKICRPRASQPLRSHSSQNNVRVDRQRGGGFGADSKGFRRRAPPTILAREQLERNVIYDEPFGVLQRYVLSGQRDESVMREARERSREEVAKRRIPSKVFREYTRGDHSKSFVKQAL